MHTLQTILLLLIIAVLLIAIYQTVTENFREAARAEAHEEYQEIIHKQQAEIKRLQYQIDHPKMSLKLIGKW